MSRLGLENSEILSALQEFLKSITALSTWCIILGVALADKFFGSTVEDKGWVFVSMLCFFVAIVSSVMVQFAVLKLNDQVGHWDRIGVFCCYLALLAFAGGLLFIVVFAGLQFGG